VVELGVYKAKSGLRDRVREWWSKENGNSYQFVFRPFFPALRRSKRSRGLESRPEKQRNDFLGFLAVTKKVSDVVLLKPQLSRRPPSYCRLTIKRPRRIDQEVHGVSLHGQGLMLFPFHQAGGKFQRGANVFWTSLRDSRSHSFFETHAAA